MSSDTDQKNLIALMQRFNQLGRMLPNDHAIFDEDTRAAAISDAKVLLAEMDTVKAQLDKALGIPHRSLSPIGEDNV